MTDPITSTEQRTADLAELAAMGMALARDLHRRGMAAQSDEAAAELTLAFHRVSRSVRQTHALAARLEREHRQFLQDEASRASLERINETFRKRRKVHDAVAQLVWNEAEGEEAEERLEALDAAVRRLAEEDDFLETPIELCIEALRKALSLGAPANDGDAEPPPDDPAKAPVDIVIWRSSS